MKNLKVLEFKYFSFHQADAVSVTIFNINYVYQRLVKVNDIYVVLCHVSIGYESSWYLALAQ